eukprot:1064298-Alexandrium_andersonii.AAC.1
MRVLLRLPPFELAVSGFSDGSCFEVSPRSRPRPSVHKVWITFLPGPHSAPTSSTQSCSPNGSDARIPAGWDSVTD